MLLSVVSAPLPSALTKGTARTVSGSVTAGCSAAALPSALIRGGARTSSGDEGGLFSTSSGGHGVVLSTASGGDGGVFSTATVGWRLRRCGVFLAKRR
ncbi:hypothetical protein HN51_033117 [Arachis hypogaea]